MKPKENLKTLIKPIIVILVILFMISTVINEKYILLNYVIFYFIPLFFIYKDSISKKCFYSLFFYGIEILIVSITKFVLFILIDEGILNVIVILIILCLLVITLVTIVQILIFNFLKRESTKTLWKIKLYKIYLFLMLAIIYAVLEVPYIVQQKGIIENKYIPKMTLGFILFAVALIISLYFILIFNFYKNILMEKNKAQSIEIRILNESLKERKILNEEKAKLVHDMKNHNIVMSLLVKKGQYDELLEYINQFDEQIDDTINKDMSANLILNNILKFKKKQAMENNIVFNVDCRVAKESMINSFDITTLFGNLIDNAIEENNRINRADKFININIWENEWIIFFAIENLSDEQEVDENNMNKYLGTKKADKVNHGFGIKNINKIIRKYDGFIKYKKEKGSFMVSGYMNKSEEVED